MLQRDDEELDVTILREFVYKNCMLAGFDMNDDDFGIRARPCMENFVWVLRTGFTCQS